MKFVTEVADRSAATILKDAIWTYIEPNAGVISACLPYLANLFGSRVVNAFKSVSNLVDRTVSFLLYRFRPDRSTKTNNTTKFGTQRAAFESYELNENHDFGVHKVEDRRTSQESIRNLV